MVAPWILLNKDTTCLTLFRDEALVEICDWSQGSDKACSPGDVLQRIPPLMPTLWAFKRGLALDIPSALVDQHWSREVTSWTWARPFVILVDQVVLELQLGQLIDHGLNVASTDCRWLVSRSFLTFVGHLKEAIDDFTDCKFAARSAAVGSCSIFIIHWIRLWASPLWLFYLELVIDLTLCPIEGTVVAYLDATLALVNHILRSEFFCTDHARS